MKVVILAGGRGTRISEESHLRPKPMVEIGGKPILWHIMKSYSTFGFGEFILCLGYKGYMIKEYFANFFLHGSDVTVDIPTNRIEFHSSRAEPWRVTLVDTGLDTLTGGRVKRVASFLDQGSPFFLAYGDGLADIDFRRQLDFHCSHGMLVTMTVVRPPARFGTTEVVQDRVSRFEEKPQASEGLINGGFFVVDPAALDLIDGDGTPWERDPLEQLVADQQLGAYLHDGFWQPMDTLREKELLDEYWRIGRAPWKTWD